MLPIESQKTSQIRFMLNGEETDASFAPYKTLLEVLREDLLHTGTKHGCELGECGACAVLLDGKAVLSCLVLALECAGRRVLTIEGLSADGRLHPLQDAFADLGAAQCGYCTPGILVTAKALLDRNPHPDARIRRMDVSRALAHPGVYLVLTGKDLPVQYGILPVSQDEQALCLDHVRHVGDPVAAVVAREELTAFEALDLIDVDYEILPTICDPEEALATPEPRIHEYGEEGNIHKLVALEFGDVEQGFAEADEIFEDTFFYQGNTHLPIEQHASVAIKDPDGKLTIWSSTQTPHYLHRALAKVLAMPPAHIRVVATPNGGGFGGKSDPFHHEIVVAKAALLLDRPVKICLTREEVFYCHRGRHPVLMKFKTGVKKDGTITGLHLRTLIEIGRAA